MSEMHDEYQGKHERESEEPLVGDAPPKANVLLSNSVFNWLKKSSLYVLPALAAAYFGLAQIWGLPKAEEVVGSVAVLETLLGVLLGSSTKQYNNSEARFDGNILVVPGEENEHGVPTSDLNVSLDPRALANKKEIVVKVDRL